MPTPAPRSTRGPGSFLLLLIGLLGLGSPEFIPAVCALVSSGGLGAGEQPPEQTPADLGRALLLAHAGVEDQHRPGQDGDAPLEILELALGLGHVLGGVAAGVGPPLDRDL